MKSTAWALFLLCTVLSACNSGSNGSGGGGSNGSGGGGTAMVGPAGGSVTSPDGTLSLAVPAGALAADTTIKISTQPSTAAGSFTFKLEPDGLQFAQPATVSLVLTPQQLAAIQDKAGNALDPATVTPMFMGLLESADGTTEFIPMAHTKTAENGLSLTASVGHFSNLVLEVLPFDIVASVTPTGQIQVGDSFNYGLSILDARDHDEGDFAQFGQLHGLEVLEYSLTGTAASGPIPDGWGFLSNSAKFICETPGTVRIYADANIRFRIRGSDGLRISDLSYRSPEIEVTCVARPTPAEPQVLTGVFPAPSGPERATVIRTMQTLFGANPTALYLLITGANSTAMIDLMTGQRTFTHNFGGVGALGLQENPAGNPGTQFLYTYGPLGTSSTSYENGDFGMTFLEPSVFDAYTPDNAISNRLAEVSYARGRVRWSTFNAVTRRFDFQATPDSWAGPNLKLVSAQGGFDGGPLIAVADGTPGALYHGLPVADGASKIADVGNLPRQGRCLDGICVVTNFGSNSVSIFRWTDAAQAPIAVGSVAVGNGPVGVDLQRSGASVLALTTGSKDNSYSITAIDQATGAVISNSRTVLTDCQGPAWAVFLSALDAALTCNTDSTYKVFHFQ